MRLECVEGGFEHLLAELALNHLDLVLADRPAPTDAHLKLQSRLVGEADVALYGGRELQRRLTAGFPRSLDGAPLLLPARSHPLRADIDAWLQHHDLHPEIVGEFFDSALLKDLRPRRSRAVSRTRRDARRDRRPVRRAAGRHAGRRA
jgi:LysR family transcriptional activator of nhaA